MPPNQILVGKTLLHLKLCDCCKWVNNYGPDLQKCLKNVHRTRLLKTREPYSKTLSYPTRTRRIFGVALCYTLIYTKSCTCFGRTSLLPIYRWPNPPAKLPAYRWEFCYHVWYALLAGTWGHLGPISATGPKTTTSTLRKPTLELDSSVSEEKDIWAATLCSKNLWLWMWEVTINHRALL